MEVRGQRTFIQRLCLINSQMQSVESHSKPQFLTLFAVFAGIAVMLSYCVCVCVCE